MCLGWGLGLRGLALSFNFPHLSRVILGSNLFEHHFPPRYENVELTDVWVRGDGGTNCTCKARVLPGW